MKWRSWVAVMAIVAAGCTTLQLPPHDPERLAGVSEIDIAVQIDVFSADKLKLMPEWSAAARGHMIASVAKRFSSEGFAVTLSDARPQIPWHLTKKIPSVEPYFEIPGCESPVDAAPATARLEVVAIQTVKSPLLQTASIGLGLMVAVFIPYGPYGYGPNSHIPSPPLFYGHFFGAGVSAVRFCLFEAGNSAPAWAYAEWVHAGFDLRDPAKVERLVGRVLEHYRGARSRSSLSAPMDRIQ